MTEQEKKACSYAREATALYYAQKITKEGWTVTHTAGEFTRYDLTVTNTATGETWRTETKIRDVDPRKFAADGAVVDKSKVDFLSQFQNALIVQFFTATNEAYIWNLTERENWRTRWGWYQKDDYSGEKVYKQVCMLPLDEQHRRHCDMRNYDRIFSWHLNNYNNNSISNGSL